MQKVLNFLGASFIAVSFLSANPITAPSKAPCPCEDCKCTMQNHCGCLSEENAHLGCKCGKEECGCEQKSECTLLSCCG